MKLLIIRHGDPDYEKDWVTEKGEREIELLAERLKNEKMDEIFVSPLGRAQATCNATLKKLNRTAVTLDWLREFLYGVDDPIIPDKKRHPWDFLPSYWTKEEGFFSRKDWLNTDLIKNSEIPQKYKELCDGIDKVLSNHGYVREGNMYRAVKSNKDVVALFCHFGTECFILSHLLNVSPFVLTHGFCALTSSVTTVVTEERIEGEAYFRCIGFGDISHLYGKEPPSFSARYAETFDSPERH